MSALGPATVAVAAGVGTDEVDRLDEHAGGAAARVVDPALVRLQHLDEEPHDRAGSVELAALAALGQGELLQEVLVDVAQHVSGAGLGSTDHDVADHVHDLSQASLVQGRAGVVLGQHVLERRVVPLDGDHGVVDQPADVGLARLVPEVLPAGLGRHPEDVLSDVLVSVLGGLLTQLVKHLRVALLECVGDVLQEDQAKDDVLVLGCVHAAAQGVSHAPELSLVGRGSRCCWALCLG